MEFFVQCPGLMFLAARWSGPAASASIFSVCLDYILRVCQSLWDSFLYLGKLDWFLYLVLSYFYDPGMSIFRWSSKFRGNSCVEWEHVGENGISCFLPCILLLSIEWIWTNYCNFIWNFSMVFLPHTNTLILLEPYCGTITEPGHGLPVFQNATLRFHKIFRPIVC